MKTHAIALIVFTFSSILFSCQKTEMPVPDNLVMDIESCKPKDKKNLYVGMDYQGGIIFYLDETGKHGLISAKEDLGPAPWGCSGTSIPAAQDFTDGRANTIAILANCSERGIAARLCDKYVVREKGDHGKKYDDWFMPSFTQLNNIQGALKSTSGLCEKAYWVSNQANGSFQAIPVDPNLKAWRIHYYCGSIDPESWMPYHSPGNKYDKLLVRPIREF